MNEPAGAAFQTPDDHVNDTCFNGLERVLKWLLFNTLFQYADRTIADIASPERVPLLDHWLARQKEPFVASMRILKVAQTYYPYWAGGGLPIKVHGIATTLAQRGHRVTILTADLGPADQNRGSTGWEKIRRRRPVVADGVRAIYLRTWARYRAVTVNSGVVSFCLRWLKSYEFVHIYGLYDLLGPLVGMFCRRWGIPYVVEPMGMFRPIVRSYWLKRFYLRLLGREMIDGARFIIATSHQELRELVEDGVPERKVIVRRNGIEIPGELPPAGVFRRQWGISPESKVVLYLGRLVPKKSPDLLLEAFAGWLKSTGRRQATVLVLAGPSEGASYRRQLESLAKRLELTKCVLFTGPLYGDAKWEAYRDADVFVLPSQNENFGNTVAEAMACSTPVIVTDRCGIAPLVDGRAGLVVPHDRQALQASLAKLLEDSPLREGLRAGCQEIARGLSWEGAVRQMETLYAQNLAATNAG